MFFHVTVAWFRLPPGQHMTRVFFADVAVSTRKCNVAAWNFLGKEHLRSHSIHFLHPPTPPNSLQLLHPLHLASHWSCRLSIATLYGRDWKRWRMWFPLQNRRDTYCQRVLSVLRHWSVAIAFFCAEMAAARQSWEGTGFRQHFISSSLDWVIGWTYRL
jgi:hypothetical protein